MVTRPVRTPAKTRGDCVAWERGLNRYLLGAPADIVGQQHCDLCDFSWCKVRQLLLGEKASNGKKYLQVRDIRPVNTSSPECFTLTCCRLAFRGFRSVGLERGRQHVLPSAMNNQ